jgi:hypothetical protein
VYRSATGAGVAAANSADDPAAAVAWDPHAFASGKAVSYALAGYGARRFTKAAVWRELYTIDEGPEPAYAEVDLQYFSSGYADWKIPSTQTGNTWIQATIIISGTGGIEEPGSPFVEVNSSSFGTVIVGNTYLDVTILEDGGVRVNGTLMDLDGPHAINNVTYYDTVVQFTARQYISPGTEFSTYTDQADWPVRDIHTEPNNSESIGAGIIGETWLESVDLKAFVGNS